MKKRFTTLRCALMENGTTQHTLAHDLGLSPSCLSKRFTGKVPWTTQEAYSVLRLLNRPDSELQLYFPRDGVSKTVHGCELNKETLTRHQLEPFPRATSGRLITNARNNPEGPINDSATSMRLDDAQESVEQ